MIIIGSFDGIRGSWRMVGLEGLKPIGMKVFGELSYFIADETLGYLWRVMGDFIDFGEVGEPGSCAKVPCLAKLIPPKLLYVPSIALCSNEEWELFEAIINADVSLSFLTFVFFVFGLLTVSLLRRGFRLCFSTTPGPKFYWVWSSRFWELSGNYIKPFELEAMAIVSSYLVLIRGVKILLVFIRSFVLTYTCNVVIFLRSYSLLIPAPCLILSEAPLTFWTKSTVSNVWPILFLMFFPKPVYKLRLRIAPDY